MSGRILWLDPVGGLAGDMICAALVDAGADVALLRRQLAALGLPGWELHLHRVMRGPFAATRFEVRIEGAPHGDARDGAHDHQHDHQHGHQHGHGHGHGHAHDAGPHPAAVAGQPDRRWSTIRPMLERAPLPPGATRRAVRVFAALAAAEAAVHGIAEQDVVFHEVGALDSIIDVVAACLLLEQLAVEELRCAPLPLGSGTTRGAHGTIPLPAPATALLLRGWPVLPGRPGEEQVTPTGAALVAALGSPGAMPPMVLERVGTGAGTRDPQDHPNVVRALLGTREAARPAPEAVTVLQAQMDDLTGEHLPPLLDALLAAGALDAWAAPVLMKKGRAGLLVSALALPDHADRVGEAMLRHGSTFGVRRWPADRQVLRRWHEEVQTPWGPARVKLGALGAEILHAAPEHEDVARLAREAGVPVPRVHAAAIRAWAGAPGEEP